MTKIIYAVGIHADGGLNILEKFLDRCDNDVIFCVVICIGLK